MLEDLGRSKPESAFVGCELNYVTDRLYSRYRPYTDIKLIKPNQTKTPVKREGIGREGRENGTGEGREREGEGKGPPIISAWATGLSNLYTALHSYVLSERV